MRSAVREAPSPTTNGPESPVPGLRWLIRGEGLYQPRSHEAFLIDACLERGELIGVVTVVERHVVAGTDVAVITEAGEASHGAYSVTGWTTRMVPCDTPPADTSTRMLPSRPSLENSITQRVPDPDDSSTV